MAKEYRVGLVGCGRMGATIDDEIPARNPNAQMWLPFSHAAAWSACEGVSLVAVADSDAAKADATRDRYHAGRSYTDYRKMIERERLDIASIATRPGAHAEAVVFAAEHGVKGIYCEKALCCSMVEADRMRAACAEHGVAFNYGAQRRYAPVYRAARKLVDDGDLGTVQSVTGAHAGASLALWGHTHTADVLLYLAGDPEAEFVQATATIDPDDFRDNIIEADPPISAAYVRFANGVHGYLVARPASDFDVFGTEGRVHLDDAAEPVARWFRTDGPNTRRVEAPFPSYGGGSATLEGVREVVRALDKGATTSGNIEVACRSMEIVLAMVESERLGGKRVPLPLDNRALYVGRDLA